MFLDHPDTLRDLGRGSDGASPRPVAAPADAAGRFAEHLAAACGLPGPLWSVPDGAVPQWPTVDGVTLLVCRTGEVSPYSALRDLTAGGEPLPGIVACLTLGGQALRGQHGRSWRALAGNLHLSLAMTCDLDAASCAPSLPMLPAVAACEAVEDLVGPAAARAGGLGIQWVNDIVLGPAKLGGVLTAVRTQGARLTAVFAGVGVNLAQAPELPDDPWALPAVALAPSTPPPALLTAAAAVVRRLQGRLASLAAEGPDALVADYRGRSVVVGRDVAIWPDDVRTVAAAGLGPAVLPLPARRGRVEGVAADLSLSLAGQPEPVRGGCLRLVEPASGVAP